MICAYRSCRGWHPTTGHIVSAPGWMFLRERIGLISECRNLAPEGDRSTGMPATPPPALRASIPTGKAGGPLRVGSSLIVSRSVTSIRDMSFFGGRVWP